MIGHLVAVGHGEVVEGVPAVDRTIDAAVLTGPWAVLQPFRGPVVKQNYLRDVENSD